MPTKLDFALLADVSYENNIKPNQLPPGWELYPTSTANNALLVQSLHIKIFINPSSQCIVFAFRGTDFSKLSGWIDAAKIVINDAPSIYTSNGVKFTQDNLDILKQHATYKSFKIYMTGHSKGGLYAAFAALQFGYQAVIFNSPGVGGFFTELNITNPNPNNIIHLITEPHIVTQVGISFGKVEQIGLPPHIKKTIKLIELLPINPILGNAPALWLRHIMKTVISQLRLLQDKNYKPDLSVSDNLFDTFDSTLILNNIPASLSQFLDVLGIPMTDIPTDAFSFASMLWKGFIEPELSDIIIYNLDPLASKLANFDIFGELITKVGEELNIESLQKAGKYVTDITDSVKQGSKTIPAVFSSALSGLSLSNPVGWLVVLSTAAVYGMLRWADRRNEKRYRELKQDIQNVSVQLDVIHKDLVQRLGGIATMQIQMYEAMLKGFERLERVLTEEINDFKAIALVYLRNIESDMWTMFQVMESARLAQTFVEFRQTLNRLDAYIDGTIVIDATTHQHFLRDLVNLQGWLTQEALMPEFNGGIYIDDLTHWNSKILEVFYGHRQVDISNLTGFLAKFSWYLFDDIDRNGISNGQPRFSENFQLDWIFQPAIWLEGVQQYLCTRPFAQNYDVTHKNTETLIKHGMNFREWISSLHSTDFFSELFNRYLAELTKIQTKSSQILQAIAIQPAQTRREAPKPKLSLGTAYPTYEKDANQRLRLEGYITQYIKEIDNIYNSDEQRLLEESQYIEKYIAGLMTEQAVGQSIRLPINTIAEFEKGSYSNGVQQRGTMPFNSSHNIPMGKITTEILQRIPIEPILLIAERLGIGEIFVTYDWTSNLLTPHGHQLNFTIHFRSSGIVNDYIIAKTTNINFAFTPGTDKANIALSLCNLYVALRSPSPQCYDVASVEYAFKMLIISEGGINFNLSLAANPVQMPLAQLCQEVRIKVEAKATELNNKIRSEMAFLREPSDKNAIEMRNLFQPVNIYYYLIMGYMKLIGLDARTDAKIDSLQKQFWDLDTFIEYYQQNRNLNFLPQATLAARTLQQYIVERITNNQGIANYFMHEMNCCIASLYGMRGEHIPAALQNDIQSFHRALLALPVRQTSALPLPSQAALPPPLAISQQLPSYSNQVGNTSASSASSGSRGAPPPPPPGSGAASSSLQLPPGQYLKQKRVVKK